MDPREIYEQFVIANNELDQGNLDKALEIANNLKCLNNLDGSFSASGIFINAGSDYKNEDLVSKGIELLEKNFESFKTNSNALYFMGNGYSSLFEINKQNYSHYRNDELHKAKEYYRDALKYNPDLQLKVQIINNLANCFDNIGRVIDGLEFYELALELEPTHSLALGNKGIALKYYADLMGKHTGTFFIEAYSLITQAIDVGVPKRAEKSFLAALNNIERRFQDKEKLKNPLKYPECKISGESKFEKYYYEFCFEEKIYLNICNYCQKCDASIGDSILIKSMQVPISEKPLDIDHDQFLRLSSYLNQIKQDYVAARFLLVLSQYEEINLDFIDKYVSLTDTYDYQLNNIYLQLVKLAFKNLYDILDKISYFLNDYYDLGVPLNIVSFGKVWYTKRGMINDKIIKSKNPGLRALYDIHKDLDKKTGYYRDLKKMRDAQTHKFINIKMFCDKEDDENIKEETLIQRTITLAKLVRNAVIYLLYFVDLEERQKTRSKLPSFVATTIPDDLKSNRMKK